MATEPREEDKCNMEIDESKVIHSENSMKWMFGLVDRGKYDIIIFYVKNNREKETLIPIIKKMFIHIMRLKINKILI